MFRGDSRCRGSCRGYVALAVVIVLAAASTARLGQQLLARRQADAAFQTQQALHQARVALIGYSASYPDRINTRFGPGYLPCPSRARSGVAGTACSVAGGTTVGYFPWHTLRTPDLRDGNGGGLWYAIDDAYRYNPKRVPLNNETPSELETYGEKVVAVILAPGYPLPHQTRRREQRLDAMQFLETLLPGMAPDRHASGVADVSNDRLLVIRARDIWRAAEARVIAAASNSLERYRQGHNGRYPWLAPYANPLGYAPQSALNARQGLLPFHYYNPEKPLPRYSRFHTDGTLEWDLSDIEWRVEHGSSQAHEVCVTRYPCGAPPSEGTGDAVSMFCEWWAPADQPPRRFARCSSRFSRRHQDKTLEYEVAFSIRHEDAEPLVVAPTATSHRTRSIRMSAFSRLATHRGLGVSITVEVFEHGTLVSRVRATANAKTKGLFRVSGLRYDLDVNAGELPRWLIDNQWHQQLLLAWAEKHCDESRACLMVEQHRQDEPVIRHQNVRALLLLAGPSLPGAPVRMPTAAAEAWFETTSFAGDDRFIKRPRTGLHNDELHIVAFDR